MVGNSEIFDEEKNLDISENNKCVVKISPSTLSLSLDEVQTKLKEIEDIIDYLHIDAMDGEFVSNKTEGEKMFQTAKLACDKPLDVHLMVKNPLEEINKYEGAEIITFHLEAVNKKEEVIEIIEKIKGLKAKVGISIKPNTGVEFLKDFLDKIDMVLIMTVEPGYGGQALMVEMLNKVTQLRKMGFDKIIEVDGGVKIENAEIVRNSGVDIIVAGTAVFMSKNPKEAVQIIKGLKR